jgi:hypothetical protein
VHGARRRSRAGLDSSFAFFGYTHSISDVRYDVQRESGRCPLVITPTATLSGTEAFDWVLRYLREYDKYIAGSLD